MARPSLMNWIITILAGLSVLLVIIDADLALSNESLQADVNQRQQILNQAPQLSRLNEIFMRALGDAEVKTKDDQLRDMLARYGLVATPSPATAAPSTAAPGK